MKKDIIKSIMALTIVIMFILSLIALCCGCQQLPSRSQSITHCTFYISMTLPAQTTTATNTAAIPSLEIATQAMAIETQGNDTQTANPTLQPSVDFNANKNSAL